MDLSLPSLVRKQAQTFADKQAQSKPNTQFSCLYCTDYRVGLMTERKNRLKQFNTVSSLDLSTRASSHSATLFVVRTLFSHPSAPSYDEKDQTLHTCMRHKYAFLRIAKLNTRKFLEFSHSHNFISIQHQRLENTPN